MGIVRVSWVFYIPGMNQGSSTLKVGDRVPQFTLLAANRAHSVALAVLLERSPVVVEFLRGTW